MELGTKTLIFDRGGLSLEGCNAERFTYPRIEARFSSPLLNDRNYELCGGGPWREVIGQVTRRLKPVGFVDSSHPQMLEEELGIVDPSLDPMREAARMTLDAGCYVLLHSTTLDDRDEPTVFCSASIDGRIKDIFDLDALIADYRDYTTSAGPEAGDDIAEELRAIATADISDFLEFGAIEGDWNTTPRPGDWARRGLLFGYPVETTAAIICQDLGIPGCGSEYVE